MFRAIPLPGESLYTLKEQNRNPMDVFQFRMRLLELDIALNTDLAEKIANIAMLEQMVLWEDWPLC